MVLGFGFNKAKVLSSAEKYVQQGKLQNAIAEYEKILKQDPKDLTVLNTVGDLFARVGQHDQAVNYFRRVGESYASDGFTVKAIAMYKKITKVTPTNADALLRLAGLYTQQGLYNDARAQYMALADQALKRSDLSEAAAMFQKILELDPENANMQARLADTYLKLGRKNEARAIFLNAAQSLYLKGALQHADEALQRVLKLDPACSEAFLMRGQIAADSGDLGQAAELLERVPDLDSRPEGLRILLRSRLAGHNEAEITAVVQKLVNVHNDVTGPSLWAESLIGRGDFKGALRVYEQYADRVLASNSAAVLETLRSMVGNVKEDPEALELVRSLYIKSGDTSQLSEVNELLAHASVQAGDLAKARDLYKELSELEPENAQHMQNYKQVLARLGEDVTLRPVPAEQADQALMVDELEQAAPELHQEYPPELAETISAALNEAELLESYKDFSKAAKVLEKVLPEAPRDARVNQRLASLYARAERFSEAARCCDTLHDLYAVAGHNALAQQYSEMVSKYVERGGGMAPPVAPPPQAAAQFQVEAPPAFEVETPAAAGAMEEFSVGAPPEAAAAAEAEPAAREIDLSGDWESMMTAEKPAEAPAVDVDSLLQDARFYVSQSMWSEAGRVLDECDRAAPGHPEVAALRRKMEAEVAAAQAPQAEEITFGSPQAPAAAPPPQAEPVAAGEPDLLGDLVADLEESVGEGFGAPAGQPAAPPPAAAPPPRAAAPAAAAAAATTFPVAADSEASSALADIFAEFKEDVEQAAPAQAEDPDTHFNLGVAFKEMGLLDEAIGELQKVCSSIEGGLPFASSMQAYTLLAHCFVEKGVPQAAVRWYDKALLLPGLDHESKLALHYELASAHEAAGNKQAALSSFMEVYGSNIDYRDVAERIKALKS